MRKFYVAILFALVTNIQGCNYDGIRYYSEAQSKIQSQDFAGAIKSLDQAIAADQSYTDAYIARGTCKLRLSDFAGALEDYNKGISLANHGEILPEVYLNRGEVLQELARTDSAITDFTMAISLKPDFALAYCRRGVALASTGWLDSARADLEHAIALDPTLAEGFYELGNTYANHDHNQAIALYSQALALQENPVFFFNRGLMHYLQSSYTQAIDDLSNALRLDDRMVSAYELRGNAYDENGMSKEALADFDLALKIDPNYASAYFNRGITKENQGDKAGACEDFKQALALGYAQALTRTSNCD